MEYSYKKTLIKGLKYLACFVLPVLVNYFIVAYPEWAQLTVGGLLVMGLDFAKRKLLVS